MLNKNEIKLGLVRFIDNISYCYNTFLSIIFYYIFSQQKLHVHKPFNGYHPAILITGTSVGIGHDAALTLAKKGYTVFATVRKQKDLEDLKKKFEESIDDGGDGSDGGDGGDGDNDNNNRGRLIPVIMDVTKKKDIDDVFDKVKEEIEKERIPFVGLINNACLAVYLPIDMTNDDCFKGIFEINVMGAINVTKKFMPLLRKSHGRVINLGSMASWSGSPTMGMYSASKAAIRSLTSIWRMECRPLGAVVTRLTERQASIWKDFTDFNSLSSSPSSSEINSKYFDPKHDMSSNELSIYENANRMIAKLSGDFVSNAIPPFVVTDAIIHALSSPYPKNTYYVGLDSRIVAGLIWLLGDRIVEAVIVRALNNNVTQ
nr:10831_t:CDS:2 [Entrophospora candida]